MQSSPVRIPISGSNCKPEPLPDSEDGRVMKSHRLAQAAYGPAKRAKSMTQLRFFTANDVVTKAARFTEGGDAHQ